MAGEETTNQGGTPGNVRIESDVATTGLNMDLTVNQIPKGSLTYALNASVENFDASSVNYQNEPGNDRCFDFPEGYQLIGEHAILEQSKHIFFLANPNTGGSEIGYMVNNDCVYHTYVNAPCLNFNIHYPIHKAVHRITNCSTEIYWTDGFNPRRYLDLDPNNIPYKQTVNSQPCDQIFTNELDCNQLSMQPNFSIPELEVVGVINGGSLKSGTYQFAIQYSDITGGGYTSYYSVTNPTPIADPQITTPNFDYNVGKSIQIQISNLDTKGQWQYFNLAVIKTINDITSVELIGTYFIDKEVKKITYTGQSQTDIKLVIGEIFEKFPFYEIAQDLTAVRDILVWDNLTSIDRINYQSIANQISLKWESYRIPATETYADELNATNLRGYLRDEVYAFEIVFLLANGKQTDGFHIPGRVANANDLVPVYPTNDDFIGTPDPITGYSPWWKIYNTGTVEGFAPGYSPATDYKGPYQYGEFSYWQSEEKYPCNVELWGELADKPIRHHKFPDVLVSPIFESALFLSPSSMTMQKDAVYPIGVRVDLAQINTLISTSNLTQEQKESIAGFKIVRGDRGTNKSIVAKGILRNVGEYNREGTNYYYPNYPYNDLREDPFLLDQSNSYTTPSDEDANKRCRNFTVRVSEVPNDCDSFIVEYTDCFTQQIARKESNTVGEELSICTVDIWPRIIAGKGCVKSNTYKVYQLASSIDCYNSGTVKVESTPPFNLQVNPEQIEVGPGFTGQYLIPCPDDCCNACNPPIPGDNVLCVDGRPISEIFGYPSCNQLIYSMTVPVFLSDAGPYSITEIESHDNGVCIPAPLDGFQHEDLRYRQVFNSPDTSFGQPFLGDILKLENVIFGAGNAHFTQVKKNAQYKLISKEAQEDAIASSNNIATITNPFNASSFFAAYQAYLTIYVNGITRRNYGWSFNSIASYDYSNVIENNLGIKQRELDIAQYLIPGVQSVGDNNNINNFQRESSVYLKTSETRPALPFPDKTPSINGAVVDNSRFTLSTMRDNCTSTNVQADCDNPGQDTQTNVISYYASLKNQNVSQWGQIYSYETIDTGFQRDITPVTSPATGVVFGGDTFISKFAFKTKLPFFIDNTVNSPDDRDIFFDELGNVAYPKYWFSARSVLSNATANSGSGIALTNFISIKAHNFDCPNSQGGPNDTTVPGRTFYDGKMYLFAYGVPYFYCESSYNVDLRQAIDNKAGDFWPHVSTNIPDDWVQESYVSIANDNTYYYNVTFSKQNKENFFSHLPADWEPKLCFTNFPFKAIYSDEQTIDPTDRTNNWLVYRPASQFDFPQNYGKLTSLDGIQNKAVLARFENKSLLYNTLLTINTSNPQAAYIGNGSLFRSSPPIDFAETDLGFVGSQHKFLLKVPQGQISIDAKRGQVFLIYGNQVKDISGFGSGMNKFFTNHLSFEILKFFPDVDVDNNFTAVGLHGVYDSRYDRAIITKLDYTPKSNDIKYDPIARIFYIVEELIPGQETRTEVYLTDLNYFCNKSWTLSYNLNTGSWISFHSYIPNYYIAENNFFYSGLNDCCSTIEAIVAEVLPEPTTTSTSSTSTSTTSSSSTTSTTTTAFTGCALEGTAEVFDCSLEGVATNITPTTTTTTTAIPEIAAILFFTSSEDCLDDSASPSTGKIYLPVTSDWFVLSGGFLVLDNQCPFPPINPDEDFISTGDFGSFTVSGESVDSGSPVYADGTYIVQATSLLDPAGPNLILTISGTNAVYSICPCPETTTTTTTGGFNSWVLHDCITNNPYSIAYDPSLTFGGVYQFTSFDGAHCGTIVSADTGSPDSTLVIALERACDDSVHCPQP